MDVKRGYIVARLIYAIFAKIEQRDTIKLVRLHNGVYNAIRVTESKAPEECKGLIEVSKSLWSNTKEVSEYKITEDSLYFLLEYVSHILSPKDHIAYLATKRYIEPHGVITTESRIEILKIASHIDNAITELFGIRSVIDIPEKKKVKRVRDKKKVKEVKPKANKRRPGKAVSRERRMSPIKEIIRLAKLKVEEADVV